MYGSYNIANIHLEFNDITIDVAWTANTYTITYVHLYYSGSTLIEGKFDNVSVSNPENTYTKAEVFNLNDITINSY